MRKCTLLMIFSFALILSACSKSEEDKKGYSGTIGDGKAMGYEYTIIKEQDTFIWKVGYKGDLSIIEESTDNENALINYMNAVSDSKVIFAKLIVSVSYFLIVIITTLILYNKNRKLFKSVGAIIPIAAGIAL